MIIELGQMDVCASGNHCQRLFSLLAIDGSVPQLSR